MPSSWHDTVNDLIEDDPDFAVEIARDLLGENEVPGMPASLGPNVFNTRPSRDLIADKVVLVGPERDPSHVIIVEAQQERLNDKLLKLPMYAAAAWLQYDCPADVLVICPDRRTAAWYAQSVTTGMGASPFYARALFPDRVPVITDAAQVAADPPMAVLSLAYHGDNEGVADAFLAGVRTLGRKRAAQYYEYGFSMSSEGVRELLRRIMATTHWPVYSDLAKEHFGKGEEKGLEKGLQQGQVEDRRDTVLMIAEERGLALTDAQRERITQCTDLAQLKKWSKAAITAEDADDLFK
jgi:hypothetical protein